MDEKNVNDEGSAKVVCPPPDHSQAFCQPWPLMPCEEPSFPMKGQKGGGYVGDTLLATVQKTCRADGIAES